MTMDESDVEAENATTPFILIHDEHHVDLSKKLNKLKSSTLTIGIILGVALQSLSWAARNSLKSFLGADDVGRWLDLSFTVLTLLFLPMVILELLRVAFWSAAQIASGKLDDDVLHKILLHAQARLGVGVLWGVLITLPILDMKLKMWYHLLYTIKIAAVVSLWCLVFERRVLDEAGTLRIATAPKEDFSHVSVY